MLDIEEKLIIDCLKKSGESSSKEIFESTNIDVSFATLKRKLSKLKQDSFIQTKGKGRSTKYVLSPNFQLIHPINIDKYYEKEIDERDIKSNFNFELINRILANAHVYSTEEIKTLNKLQSKYKSNIDELSKAEFDKELERLSIDLSWKSSQIEGNTYSLLETERLLKEKETASGKTKDEAIMLLNHKQVIDFVIENKNYLNPLSTSKIEDIHRLLTKELNIEKNIRKRRVGISGTNYRPLDNKFQILEALDSTCDLINKKENVFEKALLALLLISYIQPFTDGNNRTARIVSNSILMSHDYCPLSFRTVNSIDYKKAMLIFYEQNNLTGFKSVFINQFEFAVNTYF